MVVPILTTQTSLIKDFQLHGVTHTQGNKNSLCINNLN